MSRSLARTAVLAALAAVLAVLGVAPALAVTTAPAPGSTECTNLVNDQADVVAAQQVVAADQVALDTALRANPVVDATVNAARAKLATDQANLNNVVTNVTASLCTGTAVVTPPTTVTPAPTFPPFVPANRGVSEISVAIDNLNCASTAADLQRINDAINARAVAGKNVTGLRAHLDARVAQLACTSGPVTAVPPTIVVPPTTVVESVPTVVTSKTVIATKDDGSVATTSGSQVTEVPAGSASTGAR